MMMKDLIFSLAPLGGYHLSSDAAYHVSPASSTTLDCWVCSLLNTIEIKGNFNKFKF